MTFRAKLHHFSRLKLTHIAAKSHITLWFPGGGFLWVDNFHDILFSIAIISLTLSFIGYKRKELLYFLCIHILGGVNLQEIFLTNDMFPITCDNILQ